MRSAKRVILLILLFVAALAADGCSLGFQSVESLMRAPKLTGSFAAIQTAFESAVGKDVTLQTPRSGKYRSAYVLYDYDGDGQEEALVFYTSTKDELTVHIHFLDCVDGTWVSAGDETGKESVVYELVFCDMNSDGVSEIILCYDSKRNNRIMSVFHVLVAGETQPMHVLSLSTVQYADYLCLDFDQDDETEIFFTVFETSAETGIASPVAKVLKFCKDADGARIDVVSSLPLHKDITAFKSYAYDTQRGCTRVYIDCLYSNAQTLVTEIVLWRKPEGYSLPLERADGSLLAQTSRISELYAADIDGDSLVEFAAEGELPLTSIRNVPEGISVTALARTYYRCSKDGELVPVSSRYMDPSGRYLLDVFSDRLYGNISVDYDCAYGKSAFYAYDAQTQQRGELLFSVWFESASNELHDTGLYFDIAPDAIDAGYTEEYLRSLITLTETEETA